MCCGYVCGTRAVCTWVCVACGVRAGRGHLIPRSLVPLAPPCEGGAAHPAHEPPAPARPAGRACEASGREWCRRGHALPQTPAAPAQLTLQPGWGGQRKTGGWQRRGMQEWGPRLPRCRVCARRSPERMHWAQLGAGCMITLLHPHVAVASPRLGVRGWEPLGARGCPRQRVGSRTLSLLETSHIRVPTGESEDGGPHLAPGWRLVAQATSNLSPAVLGVGGC